MISNNLQNGRHGPLFMDAEWDVIYAQPMTRHLRDNPAERARFEYVMRQDPDAVLDLWRTLARMGSNHDSSLGPKAQRWLLRIGIAALVAGIIYFLWHRPWT